jgi:hypothetical protein
VVPLVPAFTVEGEDAARFKGLRRPASMMLMGASTEERIRFDLPFP